VLLASPIMMGVAVRNRLTPKEGVGLPLTEIEWQDPPTVQQIVQAWRDMGEPVGTRISEELQYHTNTLDWDGQPEIRCTTGTAPGYWMKPWLDDHETREEEIHARIKIEAKRVAKEELRKLIESGDYIRALKAVLDG
jgi:hypothetical protein